MRTRQSTANITHHDATHTFFIYMTTKTALKRTETKTKYCDSLEIFLVLTPRFYFLLFAIAWHSPRILGIIVQLFPEIFIHKIQQVHCCFFFFIPFASLCYSLKWSEKCTRVLIKSVPLLRVNLLILIVYIRMLI